MMDAEGSNSRQITRLATEADSVMVTPDWEHADVLKRGLPGLF